MSTGKPLSSSSRWWSFTRCRRLFLILTVGVVFFFCFITLEEMVPDWSAKLWMQNHSIKLFLPLRRPNATSVDVSTPAPSAPSDQHPPTTVSGGNPTTQGAQQHPAPPVPHGPYVVEYPYQYHFVINEPQKCEQDKPFVVILVHVAPHNRPHRDIIRSTWGNESLAQGQVVKVFFLLGLESGEGAQELHQQLLQESKEHRDLVQSDFVDCYKNLTIKTMVMLEWVDSYCSAATYAMKIDSDTFLNMANLVGMLLQAPRANYMTGLVAHGGPVLRDPNSKWYLPVDLYSPPTYPPYALGLGYILSLDLPKKIIGASKHVKALYIEDVYLGLCMQHLGISPTNPPNQNYFHVFPMSYNRCEFSHIVVTIIHPNTDRVLLWKDFKKPGPYC